MHADGGGLYLQVSATGSKACIYRFMLNGRARNMALGPLHTNPQINLQTLMRFRHTS